MKVISFPDNIRRRTKVWNTLYSSIWHRPVHNVTPSDGKPNFQNDKSMQLVNFPVARNKT